MVASTPILYKPLHGGNIAYGIDATLLPQVCDIWLKARDARVLRSTQLGIAAKAEILVRGLARVGIIALVDEATGYQYDRERDDLHKILAAYISEELMPWAQRFPDSFYQELFRLRGWQYKPPALKRPKMAGKLTAQLVYEQLPPGVLGRLREKNPVLKPGYRRHKHHQFLTEDIGDKHLEKQVISVTTLMRAAPDWKTFKKLFERAFPSRQRSIEELLPAPEEPE
ncbi:MAG TPA: P63C domain-containing protein [Thermoanaerobaculia bacterium]|nr:P63C domain-containing protein [Thermoanaerobaculia bacterium]